MWLWRMAPLVHFSSSTCLFVTLFFQLDILRLQGANIAPVSKIGHHQCRYRLMVWGWIVKPMEWWQKEMLTLVYWHTFVDLRLKLLLTWCMALHAPVNCSLAVWMCLIQKKRKVIWVYLAHRFILPLTRLIEKIKKQLHFNWYSRTLVFKSKMF